MRISDQPIYSPLIPPGSGDVLLGMESLEFLRNIGAIGKDGYYILNLYSLPTVYTNLGIDRYPSEDEIVSAVKKVCERGYIIPATIKAAELGNTQMTNVVMLGVLAKVDDFFKYSEVKKIVNRISPKKFLNANLKAYEAGHELV